MINVIGEIFGSSGYANHCRYLVNELNKLTKCKILTNLPVGYELDVNDQELEMIKREQDNEINLIITHPLHWKSNCQAKRNIVYLIWEGDRIPKWILDECLNKNIEKIICPSEHTKKAAIKTAEKYWTQKIDGIKDSVYLLEEKLEIIHHGVDLNTFYPLKLNESGGRGNISSKDGEKSQFVFLANKGFRNLEDRGGIQYLIKAYLEEFKKEDNVELILKINPAYGVPNLEQMFPELKEKDIPKIRYITENYTKKQLNELYNKCDVFVSPTRAEAFNLPCLEALACGKPVITTDYGGQIDFIDIECGWLIDYKLVEVQHELEFEGIKWATPDHEKLKCALRFTYENQEIVKAMSERAVSMSQCLTWENTAKHLNTLIN